MAYDTANPPRLMYQGLGGRPATWVLLSTELGTAVDAAGYITNALDLGMRTKDFVMVHGSTTGLVTSHMVVTVSSTGADLADGTVLSSTTNSD